jgi:hypothetical protein
MSVCPWCDGDGGWWNERVVADYLLWSKWERRWVPCQQCERTGFVPEWKAEAWKKHWHQEMNS